MDDPAFVDRFTQLRLDLSDLGSLYGRYVDKVRAGEELGPDVSILKIWAMELNQRLSELLVEAADEYGAMAQLDAIARGVSGPVETLRVPDCGHAPHVQARAAVETAMVRFINALDP